MATVSGIVGWLAGVEQIPKTVLDAATTLRVIARNGVGTDSIDLDAASLAGISVTRAAGANATGVAELAVTLSMMCIRQVPWSTASVRSGGWQRWPAKEMSEITVGIVGLGAIGRKVATAFESLGAAVVGYDPFSSVDGVESVGLDELVSSADVITLHAPPPDDGSALIDRAQLSLMRQGAVLVNTARASLVNDAEVLLALDNGRLGAYAVDAFEAEPPQLTALLLHERVVATPHMGAFTSASVSRATTMAVESLLRELT